MIGAECCEREQCFLGNDFCLCQVSNNHFFDVKSFTYNINYIMLNLCYKFNVVTQ